jgi:hypothetical protein
VKTETLFELLREIEQEDPIDFSGLPFEADDLRRLACLNVCELMNTLDSSVDSQQRTAITAATITRLVLENMVLQARIALLLRKGS